MISTVFHIAKDRAGCLCDPSGESHGRAMNFEFTADAFNSDDDGQEDEYTAERILSDKPDPDT